MGFISARKYRGGHLEKKYVWQRKYVPSSLQFCYNSIYHVCNIEFKYLDPTKYHVHMVSFLVQSKILFLKACISLVVCVPVSKHLRWVQRGSSCAMVAFPGTCLLWRQRSRSLAVRLSFCLCEGGVPSRDVCSRCKVCLSELGMLSEVHEQFPCTLSQC